MGVRARPCSSEGAYLHQLRVWVELQLPVLAPPGSLLLPFALPGPADHIVPPDVHLRTIPRCQGRNFSTCFLAFCRSSLSPTCA